MIVGLFRLLSLGLLPTTHKDAAVYWMYSKTGPALAWLSKYPAIKTVIQERNLLDMTIEAYAELHPESADVIVQKEAKKFLGDLAKQSQYLEAYLESGDYLSVSFEKLYYTTEPSEWQKLWNYVTSKTTSNATARNITMETVRQHTSSWPVLPPPRNETISNYDQISKFMIKANYSEYLTPIPRVELPPVDWGAIECIGTTKDSQKCDLKNMSFGIPTILVGFGRSGTSVTWDTLASITSYPFHGQKSVEETGSGQNGALEQLKEFPHEHGKCWMERIMCELQHKNRERKPGRVSAIYGTKWKASLRLFAHR